MTVRLRAFAPLSGMTCLNSLEGDLYWLPDGQPTAACVTQVDRWETYVSRNLKFKFAISVHIIWTVRHVRLTIYTLNIKNRRGPNRVGLHACHLSLINLSE
jgi:hypothetical protein